MKLKTLKDFRYPKEAEAPYTGEHAIGANETIDKIRKELGIKWIKELRAFEQAWREGEQVKNTERFGKIYDLFGACEPTDEIQEVLKYIFNIKEKDLNEERENPCEHYPHKIEKCPNCGTVYCRICFPKHICDIK